MDKLQSTLWNNTYYSITAIFIVFFNVIKWKTRNTRAQLSQRWKYTAFNVSFKRLQRENRKKIQKHFVSVNKAQYDASCNGMYLIALPRVYSVGRPKKQLQFLAYRKSDVDVILWLFAMPWAFMHRCFFVVVFLFCCCFALCWYIQLKQQHVKLSLLSLMAYIVIGTDFKRKDSHE